ncbi:tyrosine-protein phosphatase [Aromatoleum toluclasticum]|uniref:tyrosine-protein phosphatase n=1 Tax=Aromatoleum toluclasticum TaxID=92003 RepID=UPI0009FEB392
MVGIRTTEGWCRRHGLLFRSDSLAELTDADFAQLAAVGLRTVCNLRHESERGSRAAPRRNSDPAAHDRVLPDRCREPDSLSRSRERRTGSPVRPRRILPAPSARPCRQLLADVQGMLEPDALPPLSIAQAARTARASASR